MANRHNKTPNLDNLAGAEPLNVPVMPPLGTPAKARTILDWQTNVDPSAVPAQAASYSDDLRELAANEFGAEPPLDPLNAFCEAWADYAGCQMSVTRLPDPGTRRTPGRQYNQPCLEIESLGNIPFDPNNLVYDLQIANGNSGGVFRLFLRDHSNQRIADAYLDRIVVPDPPRDNSRRRRSFDDYDNDDRPRYREREREPLPAPQKSDDEIMLANAKNQLFSTALARALEPPKPAEPANPLTQLSPEDQLAFGLLKQGNTLQTVIEKIATITNQPDRVDPSPTWKDKLTDAGINLVTQNPAIIAQTTDIITRAATAILSALAPRTTQIINEPIPVAPQPVRHPPIQHAQPTIPAQAIAGLPETNQPEDDPFEDEELLMLEELTKLMLSTKPLRLDDPVIQDLRAEFPKQFDAALATITATPSPLIINYICRKSEWAADMFNSPLTGPHLKQRLEELKTLVKLPPETQAQINAAAQDLLNDEDTIAETPGEV